MTATLSTRPIRDGAGNVFLQRVLDVSGTGAGPFLPLQALVAAADGAPLDLAALLAEVSATVDAGTDRIEAALAALTTNDRPFMPLGHQAVTVTPVAATLAELLSAAGGPIAAIPEGTALVWLQPREGAVRYADGGTVPGAGTSDPGSDLFAGTLLPYRASSLAQTRFVAAADTILNVEFRG